LLLLRRLLPLLAAFTAASLSATPIRAVHISRPFFNPSLGEQVTIDVTIAGGGLLDVQLLDRDGFVVRSLASHVSTKGHAVLRWDGRADDGSIVTDEAWSLRITSGNSSYFPIARPARMYTVKADAYSPLTGILRYTLPVASRVHIQSGSAVRNADGAMEGPVLKTLVDRAPRAAGAVVEQWNGFDESGIVHVPDLPNFVVAIAATPLPENSIITVGNRKATFIELAASRKGSSLLPVRTSHEHHVGLTVLDDVAPHLRIAATATADTAALALTLDGPTAERFSRQPATLFVFVDAKQILKLTPAHSVETTVNVPLRGVAPGRHLVSVNWESDLGPVAANSVRIDTSRSAR